MNKYLKWFLKNSDYLILVFALVDFLTFQVGGIISGTILVILFFVSRKLQKNFRNNL